MSKKAQRGFNLLEILISFTILSLALLGIASVFPSGHAFIKHSGNITKAAFVAQSVMEEYRRKPWAQAVSGSGSITIPDTFNDNTGSTPFTYNVTVTNIAGNYKGVTVQVTWPGNVGARTFNLYSTLYNKL